MSSWTMVNHEEKSASMTINKTGLIKKKLKSAQSEGLVKFQIPSPQMVNPDSHIIPL